MTAVASTPRRRTSTASGTGTTCRCGPTARVSRLNLSADRVTALTLERRRVPQTLAISGEVVLSAGAIDSPALLLRSGIGPREELGGGRRRLGPRPPTGGPQPPRPSSAAGRVVDRAAARPADTAVRGDVPLPPARRARGGPYRLDRIPPRGADAGRRRAARERCHRPHRPIRALQPGDADTGPDRHRRTAADRPPATSPMHATSTPSRPLSPSSASSPPSRPWRRTT